MSRPVPFSFLPRTHADANAPRGQSPDSDPEPDPEPEPEPPPRDPRCWNLALHPAQVRRSTLLPLPGVPSRKHTLPPHPLRLHPYLAGHRHSPFPFGPLFPRPSLLCPCLSYWPLFHPSLARLCWSIPPSLTTNKLTRIPNRFRPLLPLETSKHRSRTSSLHSR
jgi:hypothetical protein